MIRTLRPCVCVCICLRVCVAFVPRGVRLVLQALLACGLCAPNNAKVPISTAMSASSWYENALDENGESCHEGRTATVDGFKRVTARVWRCGLSLV